MEPENGYSKSKMEDYEIVQQIGKGPLGASFLVLHKSESKKCVLKKIPVAQQTEKFERTAHQEMNLMAKLDHPYVLKIKDAWVDKGSCLCIVTAYCEGGDVTEIMKKARGKLFSEEKLCKWLTQLLLAIDYLHSNRVIHGDLKCSNILLTKENDIRLGCCIFEVAAHQPAFKASDKAGLINKINRSLISPLPIVYSSTLKQIIKSMLRKTPEHRPTAADLLRHPHLQPYLLRCHNPSSVFLPVFPLCNTKDKPRRRLSSTGSTSSKENGETEENLLKVTSPVSKIVENGNKPATSGFEKDSVVKKVDFTSYSPSISNSDASSSKETTTCDLTLFNEETHASLSLKDEYFTDELIALDGDDDENLNHHQPGESSCTRELAACDGGNQENVNNENEDLSESTFHSGGNLCKGNFNSLKTKSNEAQAAEIIIANPKHAIEEQESACPADAEFSQQPAEMDNPDTCETPNMNCRFAATDGEVRETWKNDGEVASERVCNIPLLSTKTTVGGDEREIEGDNPSKQRADALESLLELCARLLKQDKLEELTGVLKPFGEEAVSSRETAIWLTKSLVNAQKSNEGA